MKEKFYTNLVLTVMMIVSIVSYIDFRRLKQRIKNLDRNVEIKIDKNIEKIIKSSTDRILNINKAILKQSITQNGNIIDILGVKFYVPYYPVDSSIQRTIVETGKFYEYDGMLAASDNYLDKDSVVLDIGADIGTHTLYWNKILKVKKVYAFEPVDDIYRILQKNINLNNVLPNSVSINRIGLGDQTGKASINGTYNLRCVGCTKIKMDDNGDLDVMTLDKFIEEKFTENKIDLIKIDVERFEYNVLIGAKETLKKYSPILLIEIHKECFDKVNSLLNEYGYEKIKDVPAPNYVYIKVRK